MFAVKLYHFTCLENIKFQDKQAILDYSTSSDVILPPFCLIIS